MTVTRELFEAERLTALNEIAEALNDEYGTIAGFRAGYIVDIDFEVNKATGAVGIRMDNDFGVVSGDSAVEFAEALAYAARLAAGFKYLGHEVVRAMRTQQERTFKALNMHLVDVYDCDERGWPRVKPCQEVPDRLITFCIGAKEKDGYAHFFLDDYRFERLWREPERYIQALATYDGVIGPDFSIYTDMPVPMQVWNKYRAMALTNYWQRVGINVVPNLVWGDEESLWYMFDGMPTGGTFCVGTVGLPKADDETRQNFQNGIDAAIVNLRPDTLLVYGSYRDFDTYGKCNVVYYENDNRARLAEWEKRQEKNHVEGQARRKQRV